MTNHHRGLDELTTATVDPKQWAPRPWLAGVLNVFGPGLGQVYNGRPRRAALTWILFQLAGLALLVGSTYVSAPAFVRIPLVLVILVLWSVAVADAVIVARHASAAPRRWFQRWYSLAGIVLLGAYLLDPTGHYQRHIAEAFRIPTGSMEPTIRVGDYIMTRKRMPSTIPRGAVVVIRDRDDRRFIYRIVGLPGDTIGMLKSRVHVNRLPLAEPYASNSLSSDVAAEEFSWQDGYRVGEADAAGGRPTAATWGPLAIPAKHYFVLGDNRAGSLDSRYRGFIPRENILGAPSWIYFSRDPGTGVIRWSRLGRSIQ